MVLISLDAAFIDDVEKLKATKHIGGLMEKGVYTDQMRTVFPALTYPAHVSMMTGKHPIDHGIGHNQPFDINRPAGSMPDESRPWYWDIKDVQTPTMFDRLHQKGKTSAAILWPVTGKSRSIKYLFPEVLALPGESQVIKMLKYGRLGYILLTEIRYGRKRVSAKEPYLSDYAALLTEKLLLKKQPPDLIAVHLVDLDAMRHHHGVYSTQADEAIKRLDARVGGILKVMDERNLWRDTCIMLVSDHGQKDINEFIAIDPFLKEAGIPAHAQSFGTGAALYFKEKGFEEKAATVLRENALKLRIKTIYDRDALNRLGASQAYNLCIQGEDGVAYTDCLEGAKREKATHGFAPDDPAGRCLMVLYNAPFMDEWVKEAKDMTHVKGVVEAIALNSGEQNMNIPSNEQENGEG